MGEGGGTSREKREGSGRLGRPPNSQARKARQGLYCKRGHREAMEFTTPGLVKGDKKTELIQGDINRLTRNKGALQEVVRASHDQPC